MQTARTTPASTNPASTNPHPTPANSAFPFYNGPLALLRVRANLSSIMEQNTPKGTARTPDPENVTVQPAKPTATPPRPIETGGPKGLEPVRYGDWEVKGLAVDF